jgi:hypothetical protein
MQSRHPRTRARKPKHVRAPWRKLPAVRAYRAALQYRHNDWSAALWKFFRVFRILLDLLCAWYVLLHLLPCWTW